MMDQPPSDFENAFAFAAAVRDGGAETVAQLIDSGVSPSSTAGLHAPPLWVASECGHDAVVSILALRNADVECVGPCSRTALMVAAAGGHCNVLQSLLAAKANPSTETRGGLTPLLELCSLRWDSNEPTSGVETMTATTLAASSGQLTALRTMVAAGSLVNYETTSGCTPLIAAARVGQVEAIEELVKLGGNPNLETQAGLTPLAAAVLSGSQDAIASLIANKANPNSSCRKGRGTALSVAAARGDARMVEQLVTLGASVDAVTVDGETALTTAAASGQLECIRALCDGGGSLDLETPKGLTALLAALLNGQAAAIEVLLMCGCSPDGLTASGNAPLLAASSMGNVVACKTLVDGRANVDLLSGPRCVTPLIAAITNGRHLVVQALLELGAMPNKCAGQLSPITIACRQGQLACLEVLAKRHPTGLTTETNNGTSPMLQVCSHPAVIQVCSLSGVWCTGHRISSTPNG